MRLPAEGPCECDLYLTCAKFVTTPDYAPRLRARLEVEPQLFQDSDERGWTREVERHTAVARRLQALLADLGETLGIRMPLPAMEPRQHRTSTKLRSRTIPLGPHLEQGGGDEPFPPRILVPVAHGRRRHAAEDDP